MRNCQSWKIKKVFRGNWWKWKDSEKGAKSGRTLNPESVDTVVRINQTLWNNKKKGK